MKNKDKMINSEVTKKTRSDLAETLRVILLYIQNYFRSDNDGRKRVEGILGNIIVEVWIVFSWQMCGLHYVK